MANRYWVGGSGDWSDTNHWSTSSGGASGAAVPVGSGTNILTGSISTSDAVFFDGNSFAGNGTVNIGSAAYCKGLDTTGLNHTVVFSGSILYVAGTVSLILNSFVNLAAISCLGIVGVVTLTQNGAVMPVGTGSNGSPTIETNSNLTLGGDLYGPDSFYFHYNFSGGNSFTSNNYTITLNTFTFEADGSFPAGSVTINLGTSIVNANTVRFGLSQLSGGIPHFTVNASTATFNLSPYSAPNSSFFDWGANNSGSVGDVNLTGPGTYLFLISWGAPVSGDFVISSPSTITADFAGPLIVAGDFTAIGSPGNQFALNGSFLTGCGVTASGTVTTNYVTVHFMNAGGNVPFDARLGGVDLGHNTNWLFNIVMPLIHDDVTVSEYIKIDDFQIHVFDTVTVSEGPSHLLRIMSRGPFQVYTFDFTADESGNMMTILPNNGLYIEGLTHISLREIVQDPVDDSRSVKEFLTGNTDEGREIFFRADSQPIQLMGEFELYGNPISIVTKTERGSSMKTFIGLDMNDFYELKGTVTKGVSVLRVNADSDDKVSPPIARRVRISWRDSSLQLCRLLQGAIVFLPTQIDYVE